MKDEKITSSVDVLVVGLGPVGAIVAALLGRWGVRVLAIEREEEVYRLPRAATFDHEIMRVFQELGIAEAVAADARVGSRYEFRNAEGETLLSFSTDGLETPSGWPPSYSFHQPTMERALRAVLNDLPSVETAIGATLQEILRNDEEGVLARVQAQDGTKSIVGARFLVGADGGASHVRKNCGIGLFDYGFEKAWLVIDTLVSDETGLPAHAIQYCDPARPISAIPMSPGRRRWEFMLNDGETTAQMLEESYIRELLAAKVDLDRVEIVRKAVYQFHGLVAEQWRLRSVMLAGDAAHQMPPFLGQGMCSGIRDAANLAWKLAMVVNGRAEDSLLDSYQAERDPHVRSIIQAAIALGEVVCVRDPEAARQRDLGLIAAGKSSNGPPPNLRPKGLAGGALMDAAPAGELFPQVNVRSSDGRTGRLDDLLPPGFWLIGVGALPAVSDRFISAIQLRKDIHSDGRIEQWLEQHSATAVLVRPDRYVFGVGEPQALLEHLEIALGRVRVSQKALT